MAEKVRHILGISGGKDSSALAIFMRDKVQDIEYFFCDTGVELEETYDYLHKLEKYLGKPIVRLSAEKDFDWWLVRNNYFLPSQRMRWCTVNLKLEPLEKFVGKDKAISYVGIRYDEQGRKGYQNPKADITSVFPFVDHKIDKQGVMKILEEAGLGLPEYYKWRSRSGCFFCFFQRRMEWVGLYERHPDLFKRAMAYEKSDPVTGKRFTWIAGESLEELVQPERMAEIKRKHETELERELKSKSNRPLVEVLSSVLDHEDDQLPCQICNL